MTTDTLTPTPTPAAPASAGRAAASPGRSWAEACDQSDAVAAALRAAVDAHAHLARERDAANARAETAERERDAVTRAAEWLAERRRRNWVCSFCPAYHACGPNASPQDCVARLAEALAGEEPTP